MIYGLYSTPEITNLPTIILLHYPSYMYIYTFSYIYIKTMRAYDPHAFFFTYMIFGIKSHYEPHHNSMAYKDPNIQIDRPLRNGSLPS